MTKAFCLAAVLAAVSAGAASAHEMGYDRSTLPPPPYAYGGMGYMDHDHGCRREGLTLLGANAGVTVLGLHLGASGKLHAGIDDGCRGDRYARPEPRFNQYRPARDAYGYSRPETEGRW